ncbi:hypothetical protein M9H77_28275 [Catharanthus roseus]|uniref:Uncharacterized protein n=1 Tax=Catharanthus roseus TaxID=4058 RepID=A0ACC0AGA1_CATRO|nr:hypothetical protein M9H77_28275 [Catharanthus roseus]
MHFGVETTNRAESEHSVLKLWLSTCHGDLDTVFLNIDSLIQAQVAEIKYSLEISRLKEKYGTKSNPILKNLCNKISHLGLKKITDELKKTRQLVEESDKHHRDMESEMRDLTSLLKEISTGPISNVREVRRLIKGVIHPVLPDDPSQPLSNPPETAITKGRRKTNSTKRDKSHWEYVSIAHRKIGKSSGSGSGSGSSSGSRSNPSPRGRLVAVGVGAKDVVVVNQVYQPLYPDSPPVPFPLKNAFPGFTYQFIQNWKNVAEDGNCGFRVVSNFLFGDENHWI